MIVEAVGIAVHSSNAGMQKLLEAAIMRAVRAAQAEGIADPDVIRERIHAARDNILRTF